MIKAFGAESRIDGPLMSKDKDKSCDAGVLSFEIVK